MINWDNVDNTVKVFSHEGRTCQGKVVKVYDGDSVHIVLSLTDNEPNKLYKWNCRLINIDTPELRSNNFQEKELAIKVRDYLKNKILNKVVNVKCFEFDKYGRLLVEIYLDNININNLLIEMNYAKKYDGGTKTKWF